MLRKAIIIGGAVVVLAVGADRAAVLVAEKRLAGRLHCLARSPTVSINGFPFLTQLAAGEFGDVRVSADNVTAKKMTLRRVAVEAHGCDYRLPAVRRHRRCPPRRWSPMTRCQGYPVLPGETTGSSR